MIDEISDEAAVDSLATHIAKQRELAKTDVDRRAFDLLEAMIECRAAELRNQPGPHVDKAVAALQRAFKREWSPGEAKLMGDFLADLGRIPQEKLAAEQLRQLEAFYNGANPTRKSGSIWPALGPKPCGITNGGSRSSICWKRRSTVTRPPVTRPRSANSGFSAITSPTSINSAAIPKQSKN